MKYLWLAIFSVVLLWSGIAPKDRFTWFLEVVPALLAVLVLAISYRRFRLTPLLYILILVHAVILMIGGHYTYAEVPLFTELAQWFGGSRNNFDKLGHFAQGFVPAMVAREIILRKNIVRGRGWQTYFILASSLAISACYELIEWWVAVATGEGADAFLGTQGYVWDTQSDMAMALLGAILALMTLRRLHDRQLQALSAGDRGGR